MIKQGNIVLVPFPFTDLSSSKVRLALILSSGFVGEDVVVAFISSQQKKGKYNVSIAPSEENGLKADSVVVCNKVATLEKAIIIGELGLLEESILRNMKAKLEELFNL